MWTASSTCRPRRTSFEPLGVDQTTVGRRLQEVEAALGARLLERSVRGCHLTEAGLRACQAGEVIEASLRDLDRDIARVDEQLQGVVRIATAGGFVPVLAPLLARLHRQHPHLQFTLSARSDLHNLVRREADTAIRMTPDSQPSLIATRLGSIAWGVFAAQSYVRDHGALPPFSAHPVIGLEAPLNATPGGRWLVEHASGAREAVTVGDLNSAVAFAIEGLGLVTLPSFMAAREPTLQLVWPSAIGQQDFFLVAHPDALELPRVRVTVDHLTRSLRAQARALSEV